MILQFTPKPPAPQRADSTLPAPDEQAATRSTPFLEGQFLYEIYADEAVRIGTPCIPYPEKWKKLPMSTQSLWQSAAERFTAAL